MVAVIIAVAALYLTGLTRMGMYSTDEPRYADIGRAMARSGDWVTPRLWGQPWFEKPPLLYWMTATGFRLGLGADLAPRLPVALLSVGFLLFFWLQLRRLFDDTVAAFSTGILATSAGWLAYSHVAVTDLPLTVFFSAAVLLSLSSNDGQAEPRRVWAAVALGLAVLAKSGPPLILFAPMIAADWRNWRRWFASWPIIAFMVIAVPWHVAEAIRDGRDFLYVLFVEQQFGRFFNASRQHGQPWWFYIPVLLLLLFPWFPLLPLSFRHPSADERARKLAAVVIVGMIFFSASVNKLPGYILPLVPSACILTGLGLARASHKERWLIAPVALLGALPAAAAILPEIATRSLHAVEIPWSFGMAGLAVGAAAGGAITVCLKSRAAVAAILLAASAFFWVETDLFPVMDGAASARLLWLTSRPECALVLPRGMLYGLYYYSGKQLPDCAIVDKNAASLSGNAPPK